ncbi:hypothetical protein BLA29_002130 [Euroglyphus maynei]|uniref:Uncharacterized protein n=1 Tax=Euroglyphus maynei TaxID=6958 RepID=A0A1Y3BL18_EURMA|nr:hypothetical protein BLA29_002130 [Euroglyphus maynei]
MLQPKIPLTNTTRNLALQSDDALLEVSGDDGSSGSNGSSGDVGDLQYSMNNNNRQSVEQFQRGTLKTGTLRRSTINDESQKNKTKLALLSPQHHHQIYHQQTMATGSIVNNDNNSSEMIHHSDDDLPPPPPPLLKEAESTLSLNNASFPPPPSPEIFHSEILFAMPI